MTSTVLITGGSRGIGYAAASLMAARGWNVALCSRDARQAEQAAAAIAQETRNEEVAGFGTDMGVGAQIDRLFEEVARRFGGLDALVNNAAILHSGSIFDADDAGFHEMMRVNVEGVMRCCRHAFRLMREKGGSIVNIGSLAGIAHVDKIPGLWGYTASKFAVAGLTEGLAVEGKPYGIRVNCVAPGAVDTQMLQQAAPGYQAVAKPADIASVIAYFCDRQQSGIVTGSTLPVFCNG